jgi:hypothetical protein
VPTLGLSTQNRVVLYKESGVIILGRARPCLES